MGLCSSVTKNWQTLLEFARTLPPDDGAPTATIATPPPQRLRQHHTRLTPAQKDEVIALYQRGVPVGEICQRYGISRQQVSDLRSARGIPRRPRGLTDEQKRQAEQLYAEGLSTYKIATRLDVSDDVVWRYLRSIGTTMRAPGRPRGARRR